MIRHGELTEYELVERELRITDPEAKHRQEEYVMFGAFAEPSDPDPELTEFTGAIDAFLGKFELSWVIITIIAIVIVLAYNGC